MVERRFCHLKQWRGLATRYDKFATCPDLLVERGFVERLGQGGSDPFRTQADTELAVIAELAAARPTQATARGPGVAKED
ncbi:hypothetical protein I0Q12_03410 [Rhodococcus sp. CX]|nr:hypothetical protein [Rhodococcus sp. CX]